MVVLVCVRTNTKRCGCLVVVLGYPLEIPRPAHGIVRACSRVIVLLYIPVMHAPSSVDVAFVSGMLAARNQTVAVGRSCFE